MTTHTAGPWRLTLSDDTTIIAGDGTPVAGTLGNYDSDDEWPVMEANARLIAAAPDLLAALRGMLADYEDYFGHERPSLTASAARAAIARATQGQ